MADFTLEELYARRKAITDLIASGSTELRFGDRWERFDTYEGKKKALDLVNGLIAKAESDLATARPPIRRTRVYQDNDF